MRAVPTFDRLYTNTYQDHPFATSYPQIKVDAFFVKCVDLTPNPQLLTQDLTTFSP
jgi:hypothetical protein